VRGGERDVQCSCDGVSNLEGEMCELRYDVQSAREVFGFPLLVGCHVGVSY
jgi:hypothetical protein